MSSCHTTNKSEETYLKRKGANFRKIRSSISFDVAKTSMHAFIICCLHIISWAQAGGANISFLDSI